MVKKNTLAKNLVKSMAEYGQLLQLMGHVC